MKVQISRALAISLLMFAGTRLSLPANAQSDTPPADTHQNTGQDTGKVRVHVSPEEAYIWVDGKATSHRSSTLKLPAGEHKITVYNYGYKAETKDVTVKGGESQEIEARLQPAGEPVSGPWGRIQIERVRGDALVFLNGTTPEFFVGHVDEMNNHIFAEQSLIVPVGKQEVHILENKTEKEIWAGTVEVKENERLVIYVTNPPDEQLVYKGWNPPKESQLKRFEAGRATATIAVAPVTAKLAVDRGDIKCDEPVKVSWQSTDAAQTTVKANDQQVGNSLTGETDVSPKQTTKYELRAAGPGGIVVSDATVNVDPTVKTSLTTTAPEIRYVKVGDKVEEQGSTELKWTAANASSVTIDPGGTVSGTEGSKTVQAQPSQSGEGPVNETVTYKITATNSCGGSDTSTASVRLTGSIAPEQVAAVEPPPELPATASPLPLLGLLGMACAGASALLRRKRTS